jgi:hypothetical protein
MNVGSAPSEVGVRACGCLSDFEDVKRDVSAGRARRLSAGCVIDCRPR